MPHFSISKDARMFHDTLRSRDELLTLQNPPPSQKCFRLFKLFEEKDFLQFFEKLEFDLPFVEGNEPNAPVVKLVDPVSAEKRFNKKMI